MKLINDLQVKVTYTTGLEGVDVSDKVYKGLCKIQEAGNITSSDIIKDDDMNEAFEWLSSNINEGDAFDWEYEIEELEE